MTGRIVYKNKKIPRHAKPFYTLPYLTVEGLKICSMQVISLVYHSVITHWYVIIALSLPENIKVLISEEEVKLIYTVKFNQDPVEAIFGSKGQEDRQR